MSLGYLIRSVDWQQVERALLRHYPEEQRNVESHRRVFEKLREMTSTPTRFWLQILPLPPDPDLEPDEPRGEAPADVSALDGSICEHTGQTDRFAVDFMDWAECLAMKVLPVTRERYTDEEIVAHCLWEMTWNGFEESAKDDVMAELLRRMESVEMGDFITLEELNRRLGLPRDVGNEGDDDQEDDE